MLGSADGDVSGRGVNRRARTATSLAVIGGLLVSLVPVPPADRNVGAPTADIVASEPAADPDAALAVSSGDVQGALGAARDYWPSEDLSGVDVQVGDLDDLRLASTSGSSIVVDATGAGHGWSVTGGSMDLVTVLAHELGHVIGLDHDAGSLMGGVLSPGERRGPLPSPEPAPEPEAEPEVEPQVEVEPETASEPESPPAAPETDPAAADETGNGPAPEQPEAASDPAPADKAEAGAALEPAPEQHVENAPAETPPGPENGTETGGEPAVTDDETAGATISETVVPAVLETVDVTAPITMAAPTALVATTPLASVGPLDAASLSSDPVAADEDEPSSAAPSAAPTAAAGSSPEPAVTSFGVELFAGSPPALIDGPTGDEAMFFALASLPTLEISLAGGATISSDGTSIIVDFDDVTVATITRPVSEVGAITVTGSPGNDSLTISGDLEVLVTFNGGLGIDTIRGPPAGAAFTLTGTAAGEYQGTLAAVMFSSVERVNGGNGNDRITLPGTGAKVRLGGIKAGIIADLFDALIAEFIDVEDLFGGAGADTFVADLAATLRTLTMGSTDRLIVEIETGTTGVSIDLLTLTAAVLDGTLEIRPTTGVLPAVASPTPRGFLAVATALSSDFDQFVGLDLGDGAYVKPTSTATTYGLAVAELPDDLEVVFPSTTDADRFFAFLSDKTSGFGPVPFSATVLGHELTGAVAVSGMASSTTLTVTNATLRFGDAASPIFVLTDSSATLTLTPTKLSGTLAGTVSSSLAGVALSGTFTVSLDTDTGVLRATGSGVTLTIAGQQITGSFGFERTDAGGPAQVMITGLTGATLTFGGGLLTATLKVDPTPAPPVPAAPVIVLTGAGARATLVATVTVTAPGVALSGDFEVTLDTLASVLRLSAADTTLTLGTRQLGGAVTVQEVTTSTGGRAVAVGASGLATVITDGLDPLITLSGGAGTFLLTAAGLAGSLSASASFNVLGLAVSAGAVTVDLNTTGIAVDETFVLNGATTTVRVRGPPLQVAITDAVATLTTPLGVVGLSGDLVFDHDGSRTVLAVTDLTVTLANSGLFGAEGAFLVSTEGIAGVVSGSANVANAGLEVGARLGLRVNSTGAAVASTSLTVGGRTFTIAFPTSAAVLELFGTGVSLSIGSFVSIEGTVTFTGDTATGTATIFLGEGPAYLADGTTINPAARGVLITAAAFQLRRVGSGSAATFALTASGTVTIVGVPGVAVNGTITGTLRVNTTGAAVGDVGNVFTDGDEVLALTIDDLDLDVGGQDMVGDATVTRLTTSRGLAGLAVSFTGLAFGIDAGTDSVVAVSAASGALLLTSAGVAGSFTGTVRIGTAADPLAEVDAAITVNTTGAAVHELVGDVAIDVPAGSYLRVTATLVAGDLELAGQELTGTVVLEAGATAVRAGITGGRLVFSTGTTAVLAVSDLAGTLALDADGFLGTVSGTVASLLGPVAITGNVSIAVDTRTATPTVTASGQVVVTVAGQRVSGAASVSETATGTEIVMTNLVVDLGPGLLTVAAATATLDVGATALTASITGTITSAVPGVTLSGSVSVTVDTAAATPVSAVVTITTLTIAGQAFSSGTLTISPTTSLGPDGASGGGDDETGLRVALANVTVPLDGFSATIVSATMLLTAAGIAGTATVTLSETLANVAVSGGTVTIEVNTFTRPVDTTFGASSTIDLPAGPYVRLAATGVTVTATIAATPYTLVGNFVLARQARGGDPITTIAVSDLSVTIGSQSLSDGRGAFVVSAAGIAGIATGTAGATAGGFTLGGSIGVRINATGALVDEVVDVDGTAFAIDLAAGAVELFGSGLSLSLGTFATVEGSFSFTSIGNGRDVFGAVGATLFLGQGPYRLDATTLNPAARGVVLRNARIAIVRTVSTGALAVVAEGTIELIGVAGVTLVGAGRLEFNDTGAAVDRVVTFETAPGVTDSVRVLFATGAAVAALSAPTLTVAVAGQQLTGAATFGRTTDAAGNVVVTVGITGLAVRLAGGLVVVDDASGTFQLRPGGIAGTATATGVSLASGTGVGLSATALTVSIDTTTTVPTFDVAATGAQLMLGGATLQGTVTLRALGGGGVAVAVSGGGLTLGTGTVTAVASAVAGTFVLDPTGIAGIARATVAVTAPGVTSVTGTWELALSTRPTAVAQQVTLGATTTALTLPAGPFVRLVGRNVALVVGGGTLTGNLVVERRSIGGSAVLVAAVDGLSLSLAGDLVAVTGGTGLVVLTPTGVVARAAGTLAVSAPGLALSGEAAIELNTTGAAQVLAATIDGRALVADVAGGAASVRVTVRGAVLLVAGVTFSAATLTFVQSGSVVTATGSDLAVTVAAAGRRVIGLSGASFAVELRTDGIAVAVRGANVAGPDLGGDLTLAAAGVAVDVNTSSTSATLTVPGSGSVAVSAGTFAVVASTVMIGVLGATATAATLRFAVAGPAVDVTGTDVVFELRSGGQRVVGVDSDAVVLRITDAGIAFVVADATLLTPSVAGVSLIGTATLRVNTTRATQRLVVATSDGDRTFTLAAAAPGASYVRLDVVEATFGLPGLSLSADRLVFERQGAAVTVDGSGVGVELAAGSTRIVALTGARLGVRFAADGITAALTDASFVGPAVSLGVTLTATAVSAEVNTALTAVTLNVGATPVTVAAAPVGGFAHVVLDGPTLTVAGNVLRAGRLVFRQDGAAAITVTGDDLDVHLDAGALRILHIDDADVGLRFTSSGVAGATRNGTVTGPQLADVTLAGTVALAFNTTTSSASVDVAGTTVVVAAAAAGAPYARVDVTSAALGLFGNAITADRLSFELGTDAVVVDGDGIGFTLRAGTRRVIAVSDADATFLFTAAGVAGAIAGAQVLGPDFGSALTIAGDVSVVVNTTTTAYTATTAPFDAIGVAVPAAPAGGRFLRVDVATPTLTILGVSLTATALSLQAVFGAETTVELRVADLHVALGEAGAPLVEVDIADALLVVSSAGVVADVTGGTLSESIAGVDVAGTAGLRLDTTNPASQYLRVTLTPATVTLGTQSLSGSFVFEQIQASPSRSVVRIAASGVTLSLGSVVAVTAGSGFLLATPVGLAGSLSATAALTLPAGVDVTANTFRVDVNTTSLPVAEALVLNGDALTLALPAGPFVQVAVLGASLFIGEQPAITADLLFRLEGAEVVFAVRNLAVTVGGQVVGGGEGAFVVLASGVAGIASGSVAVSSGPVTGGASGTLRVNATGAAINRTITFGGQTFTLAMPAGTDGTFFDLTVTGATLNIGGFVVIEGGGSFSAGRFVLAGVRVFLGQGPSHFDDGSVNTAARGVLLDDAYGLALDLGDGFFLYARGTLSLVGIAGVTISGTARIEVLTSAISFGPETIVVDDIGTTATLTSTSFPVGTTRIAIDDVDLAVGSQTLQDADLAFSKSGATIIVGVSGATVALGALELGSITGTLVVGGSGVAGALAATVTAQPSSFSFVNARFSVLVNTGSSPVSTTIDVGGSPLPIAVPAGPYLRVDLARANPALPLALSVLGQQLEGEFSLEAFTAASGPALRIAASAVSLRLAAGTASALVVTGGEGFVIVRSDGVGARVSGAAALTVPGVTMSADVDITVNTVAGAFTETFTVGTRSVTLTLDAGGTTGFVRVVGNDVAVAVGGQTLTADVVFQQAGGVTTVGLTDARLALGDGTTTFFAITAGTGALVVRQVAGAVVLAGRFAGTIAVNTPSGFDIDGPVAVEVNTGPAVALSIANGDAVDLAVDAGPFAGLRFGDRGAAGDADDEPATLTVLGQELSAYVAAEVRTDATGARAVVLSVEDAELVLSAGGTAVLTLTDGIGLFVVRTAGVAGKLSMQIAGAVGPVSFAAAEVALEVNTTGQAVNVSFGGQSLDVPAGPYLQVRVRGLTFLVAGQQFSADAVIRQLGALLSITATNVSLLLGDPTGVRLVLSNGAGTFNLDSAGIWGAASGIVELLGVAGLTMRAALAVAFDDRPTSSFLRIDGDAVVTVPDGSGGAFAQVAGSFRFDRLTAADPETDPVLRVTASDVTTFVGTPGALGLDVRGGGLTLLGFADGTLAAIVNGTVQLAGAGGLQLLGTLDLRINTRGAGGSVTIGTDLVEPGLALRATNVTIRGPPLGELQITTLTLTRRATGELFASATGVDFTVGTTAAGLSVTGASFALLLQPDGTFALRAAGSVSLSTTSAGLTVAGTLAVEANTTGRDIDLAVTDGDPIDLAVLAGTMRIGGSLTVTLGTLATITGSFAVEQSTAGPDRIVGTADDVAELLIGATGVSLQVGYTSGSDFVGVQVTGAELILLLTASGFALDARGSAQLVGVSGVTIGGRVGVQRSTLTAAVTRQLTVGGRTLLLDLAAGTSRFGGTGVTLSVAGQTLSGTFSVVADETADTVDITVSGVAFSVGDGTRPFVSLTNGAGSFQIAAGGFTGSFSGQVTLDVPGVAFAGTATVEISQTGVAANDYVRVRLGEAGTPITLTIAGQTLTGVFTFEQLTTAAGEQLIKVGAIEVGLDLAGIVTITDGEAAFVIRPTGVAGTVTATGTVTPVMPDGIELDGAVTVAVTLNTSPTEIDEEFDFGGGVTIDLDVPAGPYLRVEITGATAGTAASFDFEAGGLTVERDGQADDRTPGQVRRFGGHHHRLHRRQLHRRRDRRPERLVLRWDRCVRGRPGRHRRRAGRHVHRVRRPRQCDRRRAGAHQHHRDGDLGDRRRRRARRADQLRRRRGRRVRGLGVRGVAADRRLRHRRGRRHVRLGDRHVRRHQPRGLPRSGSGPSRGRLAQPVGHRAAADGRHRRAGQGRRRRHLRPVRHRHAAARRRRRRDRPRHGDGPLQRHRGPRRPHPRRDRRRSRRRRPRGRRRRQLLGRRPGHLGVRSNPARRLHVRQAGHGDRRHRSRRHRRAGRRRAVHGRRRNAADHLRRDRRLPVRCRRRHPSRHRLRRRVHPAGQHDRRGGQRDRPRRPGRPVLPGDGRRRRPDDRRPDARGRLQHRAGHHRRRHPDHTHRR